MASSTSSLLHNFQRNAKHRLEHPSQKRTRQQQPPVSTIFAGFFLVVFALWMTNFFSFMSSPTSSQENASSPQVARMETPSNDQSFFYFAYASDVLHERLLKGGTTSATKVANAKADDYVFGYTIHSDVWKGGVADLIPSPNTNTPAWGVVYQVTLEQRSILDKQKGIHNADPKYERIQLAVKDKGGNTYLATTYTVRQAKRTSDDSSTTGVTEFPPSIQYRKCILKGAKSQQFPREYIRFLTSIQHNDSKYKRKSIGKSCD